MWEVSNFFWIIVLVPNVPICRATSQNLCPILSFEIAVISRILWCDFYHYITKNIPKFRKFIVKKIRSSTFRPHLEQKYCTYKKNIRTSHIVIVKITSKTNIDFFCYSIFKTVHFRTPYITTHNKNSKWRQYQTKASNPQLNPVH